MSKFECEIYLTGPAVALSEAKKCNQLQHLLDGSHGMFAAAHVSFRGDYPYADMSLWLTKLSTAWPTLLICSHWDMGSEAFGLLVFAAGKQIYCACQYYCIEDVIVGDDHFMSYVDPPAPEEEPDGIPHDFQPPEEGDNGAD